MGWIIWYRCFNGKEDVRFQTSEEAAYREYDNLVNNEEVVEAKIAKVEAYISASHHQEV